MGNASVKKTVEKTKYGNKREIQMSFDEAVEAARKALATEGFGVLSEVRMDEKFKEKLDVVFRKYVILGACNPSLAYKTVQEDIDIGLLLPCNVIVYESEEPGRTFVAAIDAGAMMSIVGEAPEIKEVAGQVNTKLQKVLENI